VTLPPDGKTMALTLVLATHCGATCHVQFGLEGQYPSNGRQINLKVTC
jgi:hypothetical protein